MDFYLQYVGINTVGHGFSNCGTHTTTGTPTAVYAALIKSRSTKKNIKIFKNKSPLFCKKGLTATLSYTELRVANHSTNDPLWCVKR